MHEVEREIMEKELGRLALAMLEGIHSADYLRPIVGQKTVFVIGAIKDVLDNAHKSYFECIEEIVQILWGAGIPTNRHDFG